MISQTAEYALRAIVFLAMNAPNAYTTQQIADKTKVPFAYLSKILQSLSKAGLVTSHRGIGGGFSLSLSPDRISILRVISVVDPMSRIETCPLGLKQHGTTLCALHKKLDEATASIEQAFRTTTIKDLLENPTPSIPLCEST
ncbi:MAG: Rrf2 family transcriptional regulator [Candidatus Obscuribacterales bacterium]|nr:Rrf2 family transcriptional regulator [Candidatus Obscuribacterales bacterium]